MKTYREKVAVSQFGLHSLKGGGEINHIWENWKAEYLSKEEKKFRKDNSKDNFFIPAACENKKQILDTINENRKCVQSKRNRYELKEIVFSLPFKEDDSLEDKQQLMELLTLRAQDFFEKTKLKPVLLGAMVHLNEVGQGHVHMIWDNVWQDKDKTWRYGWRGGSISKKDIIQLQKDFEKEVMIPFYKENDIEYRTQLQNIKKKVEDKKKITIAQWKRLQEDKETAADSIKINKNQQKIIDLTEKANRRLEKTKNQGSKTVSGATPQKVR